MKLDDLGEPTYLVGKSRSGTRSLSLVTWKVMRRIARNDSAQLAYKKVEQLYKVSTPCLDDHHFKKGRIGDRMEHQCQGRTKRVHPDEWDAKGGPSRRSRKSEEEQHGGIVGTSQAQSQMPIVKMPPCPRLGKVPAESYGDAIEAAKSDTQRGSEKWKL